MHKKLCATHKKQGNMLWTFQTKTYKGNLLQIKVNYIDNNIYVFYQGKFIDILIILSVITIYIFFMLLKWQALCI